MVVKKKRVQNLYSNFSFLTNFFFKTKIKFLLKLAMKKGKKNCKEKSFIFVLVKKKKRIFWIILKSVNCCWLHSNQKNLWCKGVLLKWLIGSFDYFFGIYLFLPASSARLAAAMTHHRFVVVVMIFSKLILKTKNEKKKKQRNFSHFFLELCLNKNDDKFWRSLNW